VLYYFQLLALAQGAGTDLVGIQYHKIMPPHFVEKLNQQEILV
jgi:heterodisulfide reductase subunit B